MSRGAAKLLQPSAPLPNVTNKNIVCIFVLLSSFFQFGAVGDFELRGAASVASGLVHLRRRLCMLVCIVFSKGSPFQLTLILTVKLLILVALLRICLEIVPAYGNLRALGELRRASGLEYEIEEKFFIGRIDFSCFFLVVVAGGNLYVQVFLMRIITRARHLLCM